MMTTNPAEQPPVEVLVKVSPYFLSLEGTANYLGLSRKTIQNRLSRGTFPISPRRWGAKILFKFSEIRAFAKELDSKTRRYKPLEGRGPKAKTAKAGKEGTK